MAVSIPAGLALRPRRDGYAAGSPEMIVSEVDQGDPKQRPKHAVEQIEVKAVFRMTRTVYTGVFLPWYRGDLGFGALRFDWNEPVSGRACTAKFDGRNPPAATPAEGGRVDVAATLIVRF